MDIGVVGLGRMGAPIARRLLGARHRLTVYNRSAEKAEPLLAAGATAASSPAEVWARAGVCITMVADDDALRAVTLGDGGLLAGGDGDERVLIDMSTVSVDASAEIAEAAAAVGVSYLRAPVSGNPSVVEAGNLAIVVSGPEDVFHRLKALLGDIGPHVFHLGPGEGARVMKLALNVMIAGSAELIAEALALGEASGLERGKMLEVMAGSAVGSPFVKYKAPALIADDYSTTFPSAAMYKDLQLALSAGQSVGISLPVAGLVRQLLLECIADGHGDDDFIALVPWLPRYSRRSDPAAYE